VTLTAVTEGVYNIEELGLRIRVIVLSQLPLQDHNAMLHLFSAREELLRYGREHYPPHSPESSTLLHDLIMAYSEDPDMSDKLKEYVRESIDKLLASLPTEERLKGLPPEERLKGLPPQERLKGLSAEDVIRGLPAETLEALARHLKANGHSSKPQ
jgi:hypothetical protein